LGAPAALLLTVRSSRSRALDSAASAATTLRIPLRPGPEGRHTAALPPLPGQPSEGIWDIQLENVDGTRIPLTAGRLTTREAHPPRAVRLPLLVRIPYRVAESRLALRVWERRRHAELDELRVAGAVLLLDVTVPGGCHTPMAELRRRHEPAARISVAGFELPGAELRGDRCRFAVRLSALAAMTEPVGREAPAVWDVLVRPDPRSAAIRLGRLLDGVPVKKAAVRLPAVVFPGGTARPYFTLDNDLSIELVPAHD
jgi:hypothetical protein